MDRERQHGAGDTSAVYGWCPYLNSLRDLK